MGNQEELTHDSLGGDCQDRYDSSDESKSREKSSRKRRKTNRTCRLKQRVAAVQGLGIGYRKTTEESLTLLHI